MMRLLTALSTMVHKGYSLSPIGDSRIRSYGRIAHSLSVALIFLLGLAGLIQQIKRVATEPDRSAHVFANYLVENLSSDVVIESWEWEIDALADLTYHHPTNVWVDRYTAVLQFGERLEGKYEPGAFQPDFLVDGYFSKWTGIYKEYLDSGCCTLVFSYGIYDLYEIKERQGN